MHTFNLQSWPSLRWLFLFCLACLSSPILSATNDDNAGVTNTMGFTADLKGDGQQEQIDINSKTDEEEAQALLNISISRNGKTEFVYNQDPNDDSNVIWDKETGVKALRKGSKSQILFSLFTHGAVPRFQNINAKVLEWLDGKYQFTFDLKDITDWNLVDINHDGNLELIVDTGGYEMYYTLPDINVYAFDPRKNQYTIQNDKYASYFESTINSCEQSINKTETDTSGSADINDVILKLHLILDAWEKLNNSIKVKETTNRLSYAFLNSAKSEYLRYEKIKSGKSRLPRNYYGQAFDYYSKAIEYKPDNFMAYGLKGYLCIKNKEVGSAIKFLEKSVEINPQYIEGHYNLALAYWADNDKKKAIAEVKKVIALDPAYKAKIKDDTQFHPFKSSPWFNKLIYGRE